MGLPASTWPTPSAARPAPDDLPPLDDFLRGAGTAWGEAAAAAGADPGVGAGVGRAAACAAYTAGVGRVP